MLTEAKVCPKSPPINPFHSLSFSPLADVQVNEGGRMRPASSSRWVVHPGLDQNQPGKARRPDSSAGTQLSWAWSWRQSGSDCYMGVHLVHMTNSWLVGYFVVPQARRQNTGQSVVLPTRSPWLYPSCLHVHTRQNSIKIAIYPT